MAIIGTYNGASIIAFPSKPGPRQIQLSQTDMNAMQSSPYTGVTQLQAWPGADMWTGELTMPQLTAAQAAQWFAFLGETRGMLNVFLLGPLGNAFDCDPEPEPWNGFSQPCPQQLPYKPQGVIDGRSKPVVNGSNAAMSTTLNIRGCKVNTKRLLAPGDFIQIGATPTVATAPGLCRLHMVLEQADTDANGNTTLTLWPTLREAVTDGTVIVVNNPKGIFRMATNKRSMLTTETRLSSTTIQIMEAR